MAHEMRIAYISAKADSGSVVAESGLNKDAIVIKRNNTHFATMRFLLRDDPDDALEVLIEGAGDGVPTTEFIVPFPLFEGPVLTQVLVSRVDACKCYVELVAQAYSAHVSYLNGNAQHLYSAYVDWRIEDRNLVADVSLAFDDERVDEVLVRVIVEGVV